MLLWKYIFQDLKKEMNRTRNALQDSNRVGQKLSTMCGDTGKIEIRKQLEDLDTLLEDVDDITKDREEDLKTALGYAERFQQTLDVCLSTVLIMFYNVL